MSLVPGFSFGSAPHFHLAAAWNNQLQISGGVVDSAGIFSPRSDWRTLTSEELSLLVEPTTAVNLDLRLLLFQLPDHLRSEWWHLLEQSADVLGQGPLPGFAGWMNQVGEFLKFKNLPLPPDARGDVVVSDPEQHKIIQPGGTKGLRNSLAPWIPWPWPKNLSLPRLWGAVNLGDEDTSVVLMNLSCWQLEQELHHRLAEPPMPATVGELTSQFLRSCPEYPPIRLLLKPGQGYRLPRGGVILDRHLEGKREPDVLLLISQEDQSEE